MTNSMVLTVENGQNVIYLRIKGVNLSRMKEETAAQIMCNANDIDWNVANVFCTYQTKIWDHEAQMKITTPLDIRKLFKV